MSRNFLSENSEIRFELGDLKNFMKRIFTQNGGFKKCLSTILNVLFRIVKFQNFESRFGFIDTKNLE